MSRKRSPDQEPAVSAEVKPAAPAKAPAKRNSTEAKKARAPRASANAVTHHHKKTTAIDAVSADLEVSAPRRVTVTATAAAAAPAPVREAVATPVTAPVPEPQVVAAEPAAPAYDEIAQLAYSLWEGRGYQGGSPEQDWFTAEQMLRSQRTGN